MCEERQQIAQTVGPSGGEARVAPRGGRRHARSLSFLASVLSAVSLRSTVLGTILGCHPVRCRVGWSVSAVGDLSRGREERL